MAFFTSNAKRRGWATCPACQRSRGGHYGYHDSGVHAWLQDRMYSMHAVQTRLLGTSMIKAYHSQRNNVSQKRLDVKRIVAGPTEHSRTRSHSSRSARLSNLRGFCLCFSGVCMMWWRILSPRYTFQAYDGFLHRRIP